jgi:PAS domain S-box-containing protein
MAAQVASDHGRTESQQQESETAKPDPAAFDPMGILDSVDVPIIVLGRNCSIVCFNRAAADVFRLEASDVGRPPDEARTLQGATQLREWCAQVTATGAALRHDFRHGDKSFVVRIAPHMQSNQDAGAVLTFTNVTAFRASIDQAIYEREYTKAILNTVAEPLVVLSAEMGVQTGNRAFYAMFGVSRDQAQGRPLAEFGNKALASLRMRLEEMLTGGRAFETFEVEHVVPGAGPRTFCLDAHPFSSPRPSVPMILLAFQDITDRKQAEAAGAYLSFIVSSCDDAIIGKDVNGNILSWNHGAEKLFGYASGETVGKPITILIPPERLDEENSIIERLRRGERINPFETIRQRKGGSLIDISLTVSPVRDAQGSIIGASTVARDITGPKRAQEQKDLLLFEMKHRIKNTLTQVQAIANQTLRSVSADERSAFAGRLHSLGNAYDLLTSEKWERASLTDVVGTALRPFQETHRARFLIEGPGDLFLDSRRSLALAMTLHELATNAVKYGALSNASGRISVEWKLLDPTCVQLRWKERGGPPVVQPDRRGFGSRLIEQSLSNESGKTHMSYDPRGVECVIEVVL